MSELVEANKTKPPNTNQTKTDECVELKNIKYQTMLINNTNMPNIIKEKVKCQIYDQKKSAYPQYQTLLL